MTEKELKKNRESLKQLRVKVCASKETALSFLVRAGICTKSGKLAKAYR